MQELTFEQVESVSGGIPVPLFVAVAVYGEAAVFAAVISGIATYNAVKSSFSN
jgi:hypothetical protein